MVQQRGELPTGRLQIFWCTVCTWYIPPIVALEATENSPKVWDCLLHDQVADN